MKKRTTTTKKHPGFEATSERIARKEGIPEENARAIVAASSHRASASAKRKNPRLKKVGSKKPVARKKATRK